MANAPLCPICSYSLSQSSTSKVWMVRCKQCYLWSHTSYKYLYIASRFGFVKIKTTPRSPIVKTTLTNIKETFESIQEAKKLWQYDEYKQWLKGFQANSNPMPHWAFADWLLDVGLQHQETAFRELLPHLEGMFWPEYIITQEINNATAI